MVSNRAIPKAYILSICISYTHSIRGSFRIHCAQSGNHARSADRDSAYSSPLPFYGRQSHRTAALCALSGCHHARDSTTYLLPSMVAEPSSTTHPLSIALKPHLPLQQGNGPERRTGLAPGAHDLAFVPDGDGAPLHER